MKQQDLLVKASILRFYTSCIVEAEDDQSNILKNIVESNKSRPKNKEGKDKKVILMKVHTLYMKVKN